MGGKVLYDPKIADVILERMGRGETLRAICRDEGMPSDSLIRKWAIFDTPPGFSARYAQARETQMESWADEIVAISDDTVNDTHTTTYGDGTERTSPNTEWISRARLRVDSRKWLMSKLAPKKYGDFLKVDQKTTHAVDDSVGALMERIASMGKRISDK